MPNMQCNHEHNLPPLPAYDLSSIYPNEKCLSSTQFLTYEEDPAMFYVVYVLGGKEEGSTAMEIGRIFSALYADRTLPFKEYLCQAGAPKHIAQRFEDAIKLFPILKGGYPEYPLIAEHRGWKFRASLDDYVADTLTIIENKTGQKEWTQERTNFSEQITFQAWCHWKKFGVVPRKIYLNWVSTKTKTSKLIQTFSTTRSIKALKEFERRVDTVIDNLEAGNFSRNIYG